MAKVLRPLTLLVLAFALVLSIGCGGGNAPPAGGGKYTPEDAAKATSGMTEAAAKALLGEPKSSGEAEIPFVGKVRTAVYEDAESSLTSQYADGNVLGTPN